MKVTSRPCLPMVLGLALLWLAAVPAPAQEVAAAWGQLYGHAPSASTYAYQLQYFQDIGGAWAGCLGWYNQGHLPGRREDGPMLQAWRWQRMAGDDLRLGAGLGFGQSFITTRADGVPGYLEHHGLDPVLSLRGQVALAGGWAAFIQMNKAFGPGGGQSQAILAGISTRFGGPGAPDASRSGPAGGSAHGTPNEFALFFGRTVLNSFETRRTSPFGAREVDYGRNLGGHTGLSLGYCDEGGLDAIRREGVKAQFWLTGRTPGQGWMLGFGLGPYFSRGDGSADSGSPHGTSAVHTNLQYSMQAGRALGEHWGARVRWNRILSPNQRDSDMFMGGLACQW